MDQYYESDVGDLSYIAEDFADRLAMLMDWFDAVEAETMGICESIAIMLHNVISSHLRTS